ncbi:8883_t:CDS:1 [Cetraspora pellucida]|uniref:8883_t:CDS:1 n=1 Tax=Cetraspora pellucida TaxID=1433469 RepID=A0ACA9MLR4_9GLOM|nr:8883_t:CDS:1 [Cetraspora pellucida]
MRSTLEEDPNEQAAIAFYNLVRQNIIAFLLFLSLYAISYVLLQRFRKKFRASDPDDEDDDLFGIDNLVIIVLCAAGLAMALAGFLLLPFTIFATALLLEDLNKEIYYLSWLDAALLETLWNYTFIGCNITLFVLLPFAYFFNETDQQITLIAKARDTLSIMLLVGLLMYVFIYVSKLIFGIVNIDEFVVLNLLTCLGGAAICWKATPKGYIRIWAWIGQLPLNFNYRRSLKNKLSQHRMEISAINQKLESLNRVWSSHGEKAMARSATALSSTVNCPSSSDKLYASMNGFSTNSRSGISTLNIRDLNTALTTLESESRQTQSDLSKSPLYRNMSFFLLLILSLLIWALLQVHISWAFIKSLFVDDDQYNTLKLESAFGKKTGSVFGRYSVLFDICLIFYFTASTIIGVYSIQPFKRIRPRWNRMNVQHMIANVTILLVISTSWPSLVRILGLTRFDWVGPYGHFHKLRSTGQWLAIIFRAGAFVTTLFSFLDYYILKNLPRVRRSSISPRANGVMHNTFLNGDIVTTTINGHILHVPRR